MKTNTILITLSLLLLPLLGYTQQYTLSGYLRDSLSGEGLPNATVITKDYKNVAQANVYGFYSLTLPAGTHTLIFSYVGYRQIEKTITFSKNEAFNVDLLNTSVMKEVEVSTVKKDVNIKSAAMGTVKLSMAKVKQLPVLFGEVDILKTLQLLPGVQSGGDGNTGFYVRGGGPDQNLILLDDATIYNTGHLFGFFSIFNSDAIKDVTLIKGGAPANYGGRLSSVVDITMKEGNMNTFHVQGGVGNIASRFTVEGPIKKNKGSFMVSARRTYADVLAKPFIPALKNSGYYFYDANFKANYKLNSHNRVYFSSYIGLDKFQYLSKNEVFKAKVPWGNKTAAVRWNHQFNGKLFLNTTALFNKYDFSSSFTQVAPASGGSGSFGIKLASGIKDYQVKSDLDFFVNNKHSIKAGIQYTYHTFTPTQISGNSDTIALTPNNAIVKYAHEAGAYVLDEYDLTRKLKINAGLRFSWFGQIGPYKRYQYNENDTKIDSQYYTGGALVQNYQGLEPRLNIRYQLNDDASFKLSASRTLQFLHLVTNNGSTLPTDVWVPSTARVKPQIAWQYAGGYFRNFFNNTIETSVEVYYKSMQNQVQYKDGYTPNTLKDPEESYVFGKGEAYGIEFFINKTQEKFTGWIGYTLAWTYLHFNDLNNGEWFPAKYDRRHDLSVVASYTPNKKWSFSSVFVYATGNAITLPTSYYFIDNTVVPQYSKMNAYRTPAYHRLDIAATYTPKRKPGRKWESNWNFSIYNVYFHANPYFLYNEIEGTVSSGIKSRIVMVYIPPFIPSVTYNFKF
ncbi:MAG: TonB-dependent receptor [Chitinophagia bacterium]|nr:TonB-dependent receptor [Chitinophagia bacterium]